jgi:nitroreductase
MDVLTAYCQFHRQQRFPMAALESAVRELTAHGQPEVRCLGQAGGILAITRAEIHAAGKVDIESFLTSRHSIRHFDDRSVAEELIQRAVSLAISTPSVCNRQAWKARVFKDPKHKKVILDLQNGNRGFGEQIDTLIVVTCDLQSFMSVGERNEAWIDGGMFSMSLVLALHSVGLGTCCLNWSVRQEQDRELRDTIAVPEAEVIVMLIAVGHIPERLSVARSARKPLNDVLFWEP